MDPGVSRFVQRISNVCGCNTGQQHTPAKTLLTKLDSETVERTFEGSFIFDLCITCVCLRKVGKLLATLLRVPSGGGRSVLVGLKQHDRSVINGVDEFLIRINVAGFYAFQALWAIQVKVVDNVSRASKDRIVFQTIRVISN